MESNQSLSKEKLKFFCILKQAVKIPFKNPNFIIFTFLVSLPFLFSLYLYESMFTQTLIRANKVWQEEKEDMGLCKFCFSFKSLMLVDHFIGKVSHNFILLIFSYLGIIHLFDLFNTITTVNSASVIYAGDQTLTLEEMFTKHVMDSRFKGPLITSIYTLLLTSIFSLGMFSLLTYIYFLNGSPFFMMLFSVMFVALLRQYLEWGAVWEMGTVVSILEEKEGDVALVVAAYLSRGNRGCGIIFMIGCLVWRLSLRLLCLFIALNVGGSILISVVHISLVSLGNILKWVFFVVYYINCKNPRL